MIYSLQISFWDRQNDLSKNSTCLSKKLYFTYENSKIHGNILWVKPTVLSICAADQRYFWGERPPHILQKKLPMALIHEGIGEIFFDPNNQYSIGPQ